MNNNTQCMGGQKKAQSTVEYLVFIAAALSVIIVFMRPGGIFSETVTITYNTATNGMIEMSERLASSRDLAEPTNMPVSLLTRSGLTP